jgi:hypothetical protein
VMANRKALVDSERQCIRVTTEGGISASDKQRRLEPLRSAILKLAAQKELAPRAVEGFGEFRPVTCTQSYWSSRMPSSSGWQGEVVTVMQSGQATTMTPPMPLLPNVGATS